MVRVVKQPEERKTEIIEIARFLFNKFGYITTTVSDIIKEVGIAKGTFYYYFQSKEDVLNEIIHTDIQLHVRQIKAVIENDSLNALEKLKHIVTQIFKAGRHSEELMNEIHQEQNALLHQKSLIQLVQNIAPMISIVIKQGCAESVFHVSYPEEVAEFLVVGISFLFDPAIFKWSEEEYYKKLSALEFTFESILNAPQNSFAFINEIKDMMFNQ